MQWHHISGLCFGVVTLTWASSGLLSMGPFNWFRSAPPSTTEREASTGGPLKVALLTIESMKTSVAAIEPSCAPKALESMQFHGEPFWTARRAPSESDAARWMHDAMLEIAEAAIPGVSVLDAVWLQEYDSYYYDPRGSRPLPVLRVRYQDKHATWLSQGLHSLDFPFLYFQPPLWDIVVIALSIGGTSLSVTTMLPAWRRLTRRGRALAAWRPRRVAAQGRSSVEDARS